MGERGAARIHLADITASDANDLGTGPGRGNVLCHGVRLVDAPSHDAGVCAETDEGPRLHAADCACAAGHENDAVV